MTTVANGVGEGWPRVAGRCPACNGASLFAGKGDHVTCARLDCPDPCAVDKVLHGELIAVSTEAGRVLEAARARVAHIHESAGRPEGVRPEVWADEDELELIAAVDAMVGDRPAEPAPAERNPFGLPYGRCHACEALLVNADRDEGCPHCGVCGAVFVDGAGRGGRLCGRPAGHEGGHALAEPAPSSVAADLAERQVPYDDPQHVRDDIAEYVRDEDTEKLADLALRLLADLDHFATPGARP